MTQQFICYMLSLLLRAGCVSAHQRDRIDLPVQINYILRRIPAIPKGMKEEHVFNFLGISGPGEPIVTEVEGRTGGGFHRYKIGFGDAFLFECEAGRSDPRYFTTELRSVKIVKLKSGQGEEKKKYAALHPTWAYWPSYRQIEIR